MPGDTPHIETLLQPGELITAVMLPKPLGGRHVYRKVRDRASYAFANVSVAAVIGDGFQRFAFGGLAHRPWRTEEAESLSGADAVAEAVLSGAKTTPLNRYKTTLTRRTLRAVLQETRA